YETFGSLFLAGQNLLKFSNWGGHRGNVSGKERQGSYSSSLALLIRPSAMRSALIVSVPSAKAWRMAFTRSMSTSLSPSYRVWELGDRATCMLLGLAVSPWWAIACLREPAEARA